MKRKLLTIMIAVTAGMLIFAVCNAASLSPDRTQLLLDTIALECQSISDYANQAAYGNISGYDTVRYQFYISIQNTGVLLNGYAQDVLQELWNLYNNFAPDTYSAGNTAQMCYSIRNSLYQRIMLDENLNRSAPVTSLEECINAGYRVSGGTCFIGGTPVYDPDGNIIGYYYTDCFDAQGFHQGTCWDCYYGADYEGCARKP